MSEGSKALITEATMVVADCERFLEVARESLRTLPARRKEAAEADAAAKEREERASDKWGRARRDKLSERHKEAARKEAETASRAASSADRHFASDQFDTEYQKAVARQMAALLREDSLQRLADIAARSNDAELQRTVAECREDVDRGTQYVINKFKAAPHFHPGEGRKARVEARERLDRLKNPPVD
jgi:delta 1-pyrroline-5-carboxylate dehydrogenase